MSSSCSAHQQPPLLRESPVSLFHSFVLMPRLYNTRHRMLNHPTKKNTKRALFETNRRQIRERETEWIPVDVQASTLSTLQEHCRSDTQMPHVLHLLLSLLVPLIPVATAHSEHAVIISAEGSPCPIDGGVVHALPSRRCLQSDGKEVRVPLHAWWLFRYLVPLCFC